MALFRSFWHGKTLPPSQQLCLKSFVHHGHEFVLYSYDRFDVPAGVELKDAAEFFPRDQVFFYSKGPGAGSVAVFSDVFRFRLLRDCGGWWVDTDVICLSRDVPSSDIVFGFEDASRLTVGSAVLKLPRGHDFASELYRGARDFGTDVEWGQIGPDLITQLVRRHSLEHLVMDASQLFPLAPREALHVLMPERRPEVLHKTSQAAFLHLWNEMLRRAAVLDSIAPPPGSFLGDLCEKYGVKFGSGLLYSDAQIQQLHENFTGYIKSINADAEMAARRKEIAFLKAEFERQTSYFTEELQKARSETELAIADRDMHRQFMRRLSSSTLWRMSLPVRSLMSRWEDMKRRRWN